MLQLFRLIGVVAGAALGPRLAIGGVSRLYFRVWPPDMDINFHMNNARYLALMDLGRWDLVIRSGLWRPIVKVGWRPVIGGAHVRFRRQAPPLARLELATRLVTWDERWIYIEHRVESAGRLICLAEVRAAFLENGRALAPARVVARLAGGEQAPPAEPAWVQGWREMEGELEAKPLGGLPWTA